MKTKLSFDVYRKCLEYSNVFLMFIDIFFFILQIIFVSKNKVKYNIKFSVMSYKTVSFDVMEKPNYLRSFLFVQDYNLPRPPKSFVQSKVSLMFPKTYISNFLLFDV